MPIAVFLLQFILSVSLCDNTVQIGSANDLISLTNNVNSGTDYSGTTVFLDADIDFSGYSEQFIPIGYFGSRKPFNGVFNGQGHTISNLTLKSSFDSVGLFGYSQGTTIQNVVIDDTCSITSYYSNSSGSPDCYPYVGSILGICFSTKGQCTISNSVNMASVIFSGEIAGILFLGGVAGAITSKFYPTTISNCVNYGTVAQSGTCSSVVEMGGITGIAGENPSAYSYLQNCANYGTVVHDGSSETLAIGGIAGNIMYTTVENCVSSGVISTNKESDYIGTILGDITKYSEVAHCYWTSDVGSFDPYGVDESTGISFTNSSLVSLNQTIVIKLNEHAAEQGDTWSKWFVVHLDGGSINNITQESLVEIQGHFPDPVKEGNTLLFWCKDAECTEVFDPKKDSVSGITDIYAGWVINNYTVTFDFDNGITVNETFSYGSSIAYPAISEREGYTFNGWDNRPDNMPAKNITITAQWTPNNYTVTFDFDNGTTINVSFSYGSPIVYPIITEREGYTYNGWDSMPDNMPAKNITITAQWTPNNYTVSFDLGNGTTVNATFSYNKIIEYPKIVIKKGYTLSWNNYHEFMPAKNITIIAQWTPNNYIVTFNFSNETTVNETFSYGSLIAYPAISEREGYTSNGWDNMPDNMPADNITITAQWTLNNYTVSFDFDNGTTVNVTFSYNKPIEYPKIVIKKGYTLYWDNYHEFMPAKNITVTAQWKETPTQYVEIVFGTKDLTEEEINDFVNQHTKDKFTIIKIGDSVTGETRVIIKFNDAEKAENFVETIKGSSGTKNVGFISGEDILSFAITYRPMTLLSIFI